VSGPIVLPWPLQSGLEAATRVLFEPVDPPCSTVAELWHRLVLPRIMAPAATRQRCCDSRELVFGHHMRCNSQHASFGSGNRFTKHGKSRCASPTCALRNPLQSSGKRQHCSRYFHATEGSILGRNQKIAGQRKLETTAECDAPHHCYCRYFQHFDGAIREVYLRNERSEPVV
jgi:hypothetical protein